MLNSEGVQRMRDRGVREDKRWLVVEPSTEDDTSVRLITPCQWPPYCASALSHISTHNQVVFIDTRRSSVYQLYDTCEHIMSPIVTLILLPDNVRVNPSPLTAHIGMHITRWSQWTIPQCGRHSHAGDVKQEPASPLPHPDISFPSIHPRNANAFG